MQHILFSEQYPARARSFRTMKNKKEYTTLQDIRPASAELKYREYTHIQETEYTHLQDIHPAPAESQYHSSTLLAKFSKHELEYFQIDKLQLSYLAQ